MALNKSNKSTPSSRSGYFPDLVASAGKQSSYLLPVRIKVTPNTTVNPLSDGKKNPSKMMQPVLIKDLFSSAHKDRAHTTATSVSTQKKRVRSQRVTQPFLNTQSCNKPKKQGDESTFFLRKSYGGSKVRRQLYQQLDSPQKGSENQENLNKSVRLVKKSSRDVEDKDAKLTLANIKDRKSLLLPPNSIKNTFVQKSVTTVKPSSRQNVKTAATTANSRSKVPSRLAESKTLKSNKRTHSKVDLNIDEDVELDCSSVNVTKIGDQSSNLVRDSATMTTPSISRVFSSNQNLNASKLDRPSVIMSPSKVKSTTKYSNMKEPLCQEMQNLTINKTPYNTSTKFRVYDETIQNSEVDIFNVNCLDANSLMQFKIHLEQSIQACENQTAKLKHMLSFVNDIFSKATATTNVNSVNQSFELDKKCSALAEIVNNQDSSDEIEIIEKHEEKKNTSALDVSMKEVSEIAITEEIQAEVTLPVPIKVLISDADLNQEAKELSLDTLNEMARLSTIGEVSCEVDVSNNKEERDEPESKEMTDKSENTEEIYESENKENFSSLNYSDRTQIVTPEVTPRTPKTPRSRRRSIAAESCDSQSRRRSARIAAKRLSLSALSDSMDRQDSFTMLENELNVVHNPQPPSKSMPASPMKVPVTPGANRQWDKRVERPLKEYMALKMNGTFLVTPDVKRFQSCLETTDTPHSRKSLSRKIFMELCDLYAESPEHK